MPSSGVASMWKKEPHSWPTEPINDAPAGRLPCATVWASVYSRVGAPTQPQPANAPPLPPPCLRRAVPPHEEAGYATSRSALGAPAGGCASARVVPLTGAPGTGGASDGAAAVHRRCGGT